MAHRLWKSARDLFLLLPLPLRSTLFRVDYFLTEHVRHLAEAVKSSCLTDSIHFNKKNTAFTSVTFTPRTRSRGQTRNGRGQSLHTLSSPPLPVPVASRGAVDSGLAAVLAAVESVAVFVRVKRVCVVRWVWVDGCEVRPCDPCGFRAGLCPLGFGWMVVRFDRVIRVPACARVSRVSRVCPGSPRCLFTGSLPQNDVDVSQVHSDEQASRVPHVHGQRSRRTVASDRR